MEDINLHLICFPTPFLSLEFVLPHSLLEEFRYFGIIVPGRRKERKRWIDCVSIYKVYRKPRCFKEIGIDKMGFENPFFTFCTLSPLSDPSLSDPQSPVRCNSTGT